MVLSETQSLLFHVHILNLKVQTIEHDFYIEIFLEIKLYIFLLEV
jgi:hypothetical protein